MSGRGGEDVGVFYEVFVHLFKNIKLIDIAKYNPKSDINDIG